MKNEAANKPRDRYSGIWIVVGAAFLIFISSKFSDRVFFGETEKGSRLGKACISAHNRKILLENDKFSWSRGRISALRRYCGRTGNQLETPEELERWLSVVRAPPNEFEVRWNEYLQR